MFAFVARQPILTCQKDVYAYELQFRDGKAGTYPEPASANVKALTEQFNPLGLDDLSGEKTSFISFSPDIVISRFPTTLNPEQVVVQLTGLTSLPPGLPEALKHIKQLGFKLALDDPMMRNQQAEILNLADIVKVDASRLSVNHIEDRIGQYKDADVSLIADNVASQSLFSECMKAGFDYFQGYFFAQPESRLARKLPASKMNLVDLMGESASEEFDLDRINQIIERDAALSFLLLKFINNPLSLIHI